MNDRDLDAEFERIVAGWDANADDPELSTGTKKPVGSGEEAIEDDPEGGKGDSGPADTRAAGAGIDLPIAPTAGHVWRGQEPPADDVDEVLDTIPGDDPDGDRFVPAEPDLPSAEDDPMFWAIVGGLVGGPLLLLWVVLFDQGGSGWWVATAIGMIVVGFTLLVLRGGTERDPFDDGTRI